MSYIKLNDLTMYYEIHGSGEPLIFIAGFSSDHTVWDAIIDHFKQDWQVIVFDNRGAGSSTVTDGPYSIDQMADDVVGLCAGLGISNAHFVGNSMGGFILQSLAYRYPHLVKSATIGNSAAQIKCGFHIYIQAQLELIKASAPMASLIKASFAWVFSYRFLTQGDMFDMMLQLQLNNPNPFTIKGYEGQFAALDAFDARDWLAKIRLPTLVLASDKDLILPEAMGRYICEQIPNARWHCFEDCGHLPQIEYPEAYAEVIKSFISAL